MTERTPGAEQPPPSRCVAWAKSRETDGGDRVPCLSLTDHSVDVGAVAEALLRSPTIRRRLSRLAGRDLTSADIARLGFLAGLHDVGKAVHCFQRRVRGGPWASHTAPAWVLLGSGASSSEPQKWIRKALRRGQWKGWFGHIDEERELWDVVLAHHGSLPAEAPPARKEDWIPHPRTGYDPLAAVTEVVETLEDMFRDAFTEVAEALPACPRFLHALAGLVVLADWLGSDEREFRFPERGAPTGGARVTWARDIAADLVRRRRLDPAADRDRAARLSPEFDALFPGLEEPRPAQRAMLEAPLPRPGQIVALEAETGSGKTEAALVHFLRLFREGEVDGMYFALPTRAAAKQIHGRIKEAVERWFGPDGLPVGLAVPGYLQVDDKSGLPDGWGVLWDDERTRDRGWAVENPKRYLSGPVMVGTIDQALLGGLRVRHAQFRSGPMLRLLLVVDEVHASDTYMTTLLRNLLSLHSAAGGHALLMSATLGASARERLLRPAERVEPRLIPAVRDAEAVPYPSVQRSRESLRGLAHDGRSKDVRVELLDPASEGERLLLRLRDAAEKGAVVLFIRNRVQDACDAVRGLEDRKARLFRCERVVAPHHSRFAAEDRRLLDKALEAALGKKRSKGVVAVTTQTAEQSLDICADWLVTDIAPGDVLLQRIGRLHRHAENLRPTGYEAPLVTVLTPDPERFEDFVRQRKRPQGLGTVYQNLVGLLATRDWLDRRGRIRIPRDNRALVEAVTNDGGLREFASSCGGKWPEQLEGFLAGKGVEGVRARAVRIEWEKSLADNQKIPNLEAPTRLGLRDRRVELPNPCPGPFGQPVQVLCLPQWMAPDLDEDVTPEDVVVSKGEIRFRLGDRSFLYDRFGLAKSGR